MTLLLVFIFLFGYSFITGMTYFILKSIYPKKDYMDDKEVEWIAGSILWFIGIPLACGIYVSKKIAEKINIWKRNRKSS